MKPYFLLAAAVLAIGVDTATADTMNIRVEASSAKTACGNAFRQAKRDAANYCRNHGQVVNIQYGQCTTQNISRVYGGRRTFVARLAIVPKCRRQH